RTAITLQHQALDDRKGNADRFRTNPDCPQTLPTRTVTLVVNLPVRPVASIAELFLFLTDPDNGAGLKVDGQTTQTSNRDVLSPGHLLLGNFLPSDLTIRMYRYNDRKW